MIKYKKKTGYCYHYWINSTQFIKKFYTDYEFIVEDCMDNI